MFDDDLLYENLPIQDEETLDLIHNEFDQEQALISKKNTNYVFSIEREYVNSKSFHDKFEQLPLSKYVQEKLYKETGRLLDFVDGLDEEKIEQERMTAIDFRTGERIVDNFKREGSTYKTGFTSEEMEKILQCTNSIIVIHNHSHNGRPSGKDLLTYLHENKIKLSIIACHNGDLYAIYWVKEEFETLYNRRIEERKISLSNIDEIKRLAMTDMYRLNEQLSEKDKFFKVVKL